MNFIFWAMASQGQGLSGGDRIYTEFMRRWSKKFSVTLVTWAEGVRMIERQGVDLEKLNINVKNIDIGFSANYLFRIVKSCWAAARFDFKNSSDIYLYSASEFWMDSFACAIIKLRFPKINWVASWYQTAPNPIRGFANGRYRVSALMLWLAQAPVKPLIVALANVVLVNNDNEKLEFKNKNVVVVLGAVDTIKIDQYLEGAKTITKKYAAVFQGRFHAQKGVIELVKIWSMVVKKIPDSKLCMIGDGPLMLSVKQEISKLHLSGLIDLPGYLFDGVKKYEIFSQSKLVVHPAMFDSGGMAAAEAMAFGLPCISFDLPAYDSYYPGVVQKIKIGDLGLFAARITDLLLNSKQRQALGELARDFIYTRYSWDKRADEVLTEIIK